MHRKFGLTLTCVFLCAQLITIMHMAEYGFGKHEHNGKTCSIFLSGEQSKQNISNNVVISHCLNIIQSCFLPTVQPFISLNHYSPSIPRAPPIFS